MSLSSSIDIALIVMGNIREASSLYCIIFEPKSLLLNYLRPVIFETSYMIYGSIKQLSYQIASYYSNKITNNWIQQQAPNSSWPTRIIWRSFILLASKFKRVSRHNDAFYVK